MIPSKRQRDHRQCGDCSLCCSALRIMTFNKPAGHFCQYCPTGRGGCEIYTIRPTECRAFSCLWLDGELPRPWRPDKVGVVFYRGKASLYVATMPGVEPKINVAKVVEKSLRQGTAVIAVEGEAPRKLIKPDGLELEVPSCFEM